MSTPTLEEARSRLEEALGVSGVDWWLDEAVRVVMAYRALCERRRVYDVSTVGMRIRTAREIVGLTQHALAARLGKNKRGKTSIGWNVSNWERGVQDLPAEFLRPLCTILGVTHAWLLGDSDEGGPPMPGGILRKQKLVNWSAKTIREKKRVWAKAELERLRGLRPPKEPRAAKGGQAQVIGTGQDEGSPVPNGQS